MRVSRQTGQDFGATMSASLPSCDHIPKRADAEAQKKGKAV
jgi:hypothetical protein